MQNESIKPRNVILILADDLGFGDLGCYGNPIVQTPALDALAQGGTRLLQHYAEAPICAPSRAGLLTGRHHHRCGAVDVPSNKGLDRIALSERTMAEAFRDYGYATGMIGKWHNGLHDLAYHPNARGFNEFAGFLNGGMDYWRWALDYNGSTKHADGRYLTDVFTDEAVGFIERHAEEPFFLYLAYNAPHAPMQAPAEVVEKYAREHNLSPTVATLYAMIEILDTGIGRIMEQLRKLDLEQETIVLFTSDNGAWLGDDFQRYNGPFRGMKSDVLEGGIRVPAIVHAPGLIAAGRDSNEMINSVDWFPTLMELAGLSCFAPLHPFDGVSVAPLLRGETQTVSRLRYWQFNRYDPLPRCNAAMRDGPWKLCFPFRNGGNWKWEGDNIWYQQGCVEPHRLMPVDPTPTVRPEVGEPLLPQLFHIDDDPQEMRDLAALEPKRMEEMTRQWDAWWEEMMRDFQQARKQNVRCHFR